MEKGFLSFLNNLKKEAVLHALSIIFIILVNTNLVYALCEENQIDINTASAGELDKLYGIGPVKADAIVSSRPFNSLDDLINVNGIGEKTLEGIKNQGLACVDSDYDKNDEDDVTPNSDEEEEKEQDNKENTQKNIEKKENAILTNLNIDKIDKENNASEIVKLEAKSIKSDIYISKQEKVKQYSVYLFFIFLFLSAVFFVIKRFKKIKERGVI
ncbi:MAG: helix-hairpin-helix domain-containing protein [Nanoarchaeota archaeon]